MTVLAELLRKHDIEQTHHQLSTGQEFIATERYTGVADGAEVVNLFVGVPADSTVDALVGTAFATGGLAHLEVHDAASIDAAGTALPYQAKGIENAMQTTVEAGGTYTATGDTLPTILPGTNRTAGPAASSGGRAAAEVRLLQPGEGVEFVVTNESGGPSAFDVEVSVIEVER